MDVTWVLPYQWYLTKYICARWHIVAPIKPLFYKRYVDDTYVRRKKNTKDELFEKPTISDKILWEFSKVSLKIPPLPLCNVANS